MGDVTDDPIADVPPEQKSTAAGGPIVSDANSLLLFVFLHMLILIYYRAAWYSLETIIFDEFPAVKAYSVFLLIPFLAPLAGMMASIVNPSVGGITGWTIGVVIGASVLMVLTWMYVLLAGIPPQSKELIAALFRGPAAVSRPAVAAA
jgi:uncharacterized oligopeptide transporter (OPT) family protein